MENAPQQTAASALPPTLPDHPLVPTPQTTIKPGPAEPRNDFSWRRADLAVIWLLCLSSAAATAALAANRAAWGDDPPFIEDRAAAAREKVDPNTAPEASLRRIPNVGPTRAAAIVAYRKMASIQPTTQPVFRGPDDLRKVKGIGPGLEASMRPYLKFPT